MRSFGTEGRVRPEYHYIVPRTEEIIDFISRVKNGKYIVLFAPRQTGKTTFFRLALEALVAEDPTYFPIQLDFQTMHNAPPLTFYHQLHYQINRQIKSVFQNRGEVPSEALTQFLENTTLTDHFSMEAFFENLESFLDNDFRNQRLASTKVVLLIDEFDGIPRTTVSNFLYTLRQIYLSDEMQCPHSVGIVGVKSIAQLDYDRSVSPFNIQDEFRLPNFTLEQVQELLSQYTHEVGQVFAPEVVESIHNETAGQPVLVNRLAQILTTEFDIPKTEPITIPHFLKAQTQLVRGRNINIQHLTTNIRKDKRFERLLMNIMSYEEGLDFNLRDPHIDELATYGVIVEDGDGMCQIANPIYLYCIMQAFKPTMNGLEQEYFHEDNIDGFQGYLTATGQIDMERLLDNFRDFIARAGFKILQVPDTPQESVGRHLLLTYLDLFARSVGGVLSFEVGTGRGRMDLLITHKGRKYIVETKIWRGSVRYHAGKRQLAAYLKLEGAVQGYYVVFDHRRDPEPRVETEELDGVVVRSYVIPVMQEQPSAQ
ncbi:MAG: AAA-like domain-containing protein [Candidatus Poribacteria bacterium]|nr:AAA-like domain-containing protein [Candidatus Poribacteria bacterium]